jgi:hypothetical protein
MTNEVYRALTASFAALNIRLSPTADVSALYSALTAAGITLEADGNMLSGVQHGAPINVSTALRALSTKPELDQHFIRESSRVTHLSDLKDTRSKAEFIANGGDFAKLVADSRGAKLRPDVRLGLDADRGDAAAWTRAEKLQFIGTFGDREFARILARPDRTKK